MERHQRRHHRPGREHRPGSSRQAYSDDQETFRNPRNEYRDDTGRDDDWELGQHGSSDYRDRDFESDEAERYGASERGYGYGDYGFRDDSRERNEPLYGTRRQGQSRDTWAHPESGDFSDTRTRWPRDDRYRSEPRSQNWPHSRSGGRVSEYGYFGEESERGGFGGRQQRGSRYGFGGRPQGGPQSAYTPQAGSQYGYAQQQGETGHGDRSFQEDYSGRGPKNYARSDERIKEDICDELSSDPECDAEDIEIEVKDGMVSLSGTVPSRKMKHRAEDIADVARGVKDVDNRIRVTGRIGRGGAGSSRKSGESAGGTDRSSGAEERSRKGESQASSRSGSKS
jgi:osmotically-inducible protein OsmY